MFRYRLRHSSGPEIEVANRNGRCNASVLRLMPLWTIVYFPLARTFLESLSGLVPHRRNELARG